MPTVSLSKNTHFTFWNSWDAIFIMLLEFLGALALGFFFFFFLKRSILTVFIIGPAIEPPYCLRHLCREYFCQQRAFALCKPNLSRVFDLFFRLTTDNLFVFVMRRLCRMFKTLVWWLSRRPTSHPAQVVQSVFYQLSPHPITPCLLVVCQSLLSKVLLEALCRSLCRAKWSSIRREHLWMGTENQRHM